MRIFYYFCLLVLFDQFSYAFFLLGGRRKREVTVITRNAGDPCPVIVDNNRNIGVGLQYGPRYFGDFFAQGYNARRNSNWGFDVGSPGFGLNRGFNFQVPLGAGIVVPPKRYASDCNPNAPQTQFIGSQRQNFVSHQSRIVQDYVPPSPPRQETPNYDKPYYSHQNSYNSLPYRPGALWARPNY
uniref:Uncharacterized protein n=1 Tax=Romanomermis culicivorax TaxID=13658 RepID=A0A915J8K3_ROMCU